MPRDEFVGVDGSFERGFSSSSSSDWCGDRTRFVRFKDIEASEFLVDEREGLESLGFEDLLVEPRLDFILLLFCKFLVIVVDVSVQL